MSYQISNSLFSKLQTKIRAQKKYKYHLCLEACLEYQISSNTALILLIELWWKFTLTHADFISLEN